VLASEEQRNKVLSQAKKLVRQHHVQESVYTTGSNSQTKREETGTGSAAETQEGTRRNEPHHSSRQDCSQTADTEKGRSGKDVELGSNTVSIVQEEILRNTRGLEMK